MSAQATGKVIYHLKYLETISSLVVSKTQIKDELAFALYNVYRKLVEISDPLTISKLTTQELLDFFLETEAQEYLINISPNSYWAWKIVSEANIFIGKRKISKETLEQAATCVSEDFFYKNSYLLVNYPHLSTAETSALTSLGYLLIEIKDQKFLTLINPIFKIDC